jgi:hypothetical protein
MFRHFSISSRVFLNKTMDEDEILEEIERIEHFESKYTDNCIFSSTPHKKSHSDKRCCCGSHSANPHRQYKGRQWERHQ